METTNRRLNKVAKITVYFWIMKVLATNTDPGNKYLVPWGWGYTTVGINKTKAEKALGKGEPQQVPPWKTSVGLVLRHSLPWLSIGVATWFVALTFDPNTPVLHVVFAGILSWVIGFVVVFVPGPPAVRT